MDYRVICGSSACLCRPLTIILGSSPPLFPSACNHDLKISTCSQPSISAKQSSKTQPTTRTDMTSTPPIEDRERRQRYEESLAGRKLTNLRGDPYPSADFELLGLTNDGHLPRGKTPFVSTEQAASELVSALGLVPRRRKLSGGRSTRPLASLSRRSFLERRHRVQGLQRPGPHLLPRSVAGERVSDVGAAGGFSVVRGRWVGCRAFRSGGLAIWSIRLRFG